MKSFSLKNIRWNGVVVVLAIALATGLLLVSLFKNEQPFKFGLDIAGGSALTYVADMTEIPSGDEREALEALRDVIETRINAFGVAEPSVYTQIQTIGDESQKYQLTVELPGVTDIEAAKQAIGETPLLEFKLEKDGFDQDAFMLGEGQEINEQALLNALYEPTGLTGRYLERATLAFTQAGGGQGLAGMPYIQVEFNREGSDLLAELTQENVGRVMAIFLDGNVISAPVIQTEILGGTASITGQFTLEEAKQLVGRLNTGALPTPVTLSETNIVSPSLGQEALELGAKAGLIALAIVILYLIITYRMLGLFAAIGLAWYATVLMLFVQSIPVTLTTAGIAGLIISIGMAVDANILMFERYKEEKQNDTHKNKTQAWKAARKRAWTSIRDANISTLIAALVLFIMGTSIMKGFALTFGLGVIVSMVSAVWLVGTMLALQFAKSDKKS